MHPFGWILETDENQIKIDWEHSGWEWFDPQQVLNGTMTDQCVPNLHKSLQRIYFGPQGMFRDCGVLVDRDTSAGAAFLQTIRGLKTNTKDGARVLATEALKGLLQITECFRASSTEGQRPGEHWRALRVAAYHLIYSGRPSMNAAISAAVLDALQTISEDLQDDEVNLHFARDVLEKSISARISTSSQIAQAFSTFIEEEMNQEYPPSESSAAHQCPTEKYINILTMSMSSTIMVALQQLIQDRRIKATINLTIFESRPSCEGTTLAAYLLQSVKDSDMNSSLNIKIAPESHSLLLMQHKSIVLLGADRITSTGHVINKTGSAQLALVASTFAPSRQCKVVVLSEEDKIAKPDPNFLESYTKYTEKEDQGSQRDDDKQELAAASEKELNQGHVEKHDAAEVYHAWPEEAQQILLPYMKSNRDRNTQSNVSVEVENIYFEAINQAHINHYISENGELSRSRILRKSISRAKIEEQLFNDLYD